MNFLVAHKRILETSILTDVAIATFRNVCALHHVTRPLHPRFSQLIPWTRHCHWIVYEIIPLDCLYLFLSTTISSKYLTRSMYSTAMVGTIRNALEKLINNRNKMADFEEHNYMLWPSLTKMSDSKISQKHKKDKDSLSDSPSSTGLRSEKFVTIDVDVQFKPLAVSRSIRFLNLTCQRLMK